MDLCERHGDLTPTQKIKRNVVNTKYAALCDEMYADTAEQVEQRKEGKGGKEKKEE